MAVLCPHCGSGFRKQGHCDQHIIDKHTIRPPAPPKTFVVCQTCGKNFKSQVAYQSHAESKYHKKRGLQKVASSSQSVPKPGTSSATATQVVGRPAVAASSLNVATQTSQTSHTIFGFARVPTVPKPPVQCDQCGETLDSLKNLDQHYSSSLAHPWCLTCKFGFKNVTALREHMVAEHKPAPPTYRCSSCDMSFESDETLRAHLRDESFVEHVICIRCDEGFQDRRAWNEHNGEVHPLVLCSTCKRYVWLDDLEEHFRESPNHPTCEMCDEGFENHLSFYQHALEEHPELCCGICGTAFLSPDLLSRHFLESPAHPACKICEVGFFLPTDFNEHVEQNHSSDPDTDPGQDDSEDGSDADIEEGTSPCSFWSDPCDQQQILEVETERLSPAFSSHSILPRAVSQYRHSSSSQSSPSGPAVSPLDEPPSPADTGVSPASISESEVSGQTTPHREAFTVESPSSMVLSLPRRSATFPLVHPALVSLPELDLSQPLPTHLSARLAISTWEAAPGPGDQDAVTPLIEVLPSHEAVQTPEDVANCLSPQELAASDEPLLHAVPAPTGEEDNPQAKNIRKASEASEATLVNSSGVQPRWNCRICLKDPHEPTATLCGHIFCYSCIVQELPKTFQCPVCRKDMLIRLQVGN